MNHKALLVLTLLTGLAGCGLTSPQAVYEGIRAQEKAKAVGTNAPPNQGLPRYDQYEKERSVRPENR
jgi:hypothetical protein